MAAFRQDQYETPASAAQVRDLSAQVQAIQGRLAALQSPRRRPIGPFVHAGVVVLLVLALAASVIHPLRTETRTVTQVRVVHEVRTVSMVRVVHDVRVVVQTATPVPAPLASAVTVCAGSGFDLAVALCRLPAATLPTADLSNAQLSYTGKGGGTFGATQLTIALSQDNAGGGMIPLGRIAVGVLLTSTSQASRLQGVFDALGAHARPGTYLVEVDQGDINLGAARFTIAG
jgi:hypothetical protein